MGTIQRGTRNVLRNPVRMVLVVLLLGISLMFVVAMLTLNAGASERVSNARIQIGTGIDVRPAGDIGGERTLSNTDVEKIKRTPGIANAERFISRSYEEQALKGSVDLGRIKIVGGQPARDNTLPPSIYGVEPGANRFIGAFGTTITPSIIQGRNLASTDEENMVAVMGKALALANGLHVGSAFTLQGKTLTLVGLFETGESSYNNTIMLPLKTAQHLYQLDGVSQVRAYATSVEQVTQVTSSLHTTLGKAVDVLPRSQSFTDTLNTLTAVQNNIQATLYASLTTMILVISFSVILLVRERTQEIWLLKALGASHWQVVSQFAIEVLTLSGCAASVAAIILALAGPFLASKFDLLPQSHTDLPPGAKRFGPPTPVLDSASQHLAMGLNLQTVILVFIIGTLLAIIVSTIPAWYVSRIRPAIVLRQHVD